MKLDPNVVHAWGVLFMIVAICLFALGAVHYLFAGEKISVEVIRRYIQANLRHV